jgi:hypothetical protein
MIGVRTFPVKRLPEVLVLTTFREATASPWEEKMLKLKMLVVPAVLLAVLASAPSVGAGDRCWNLSPFGNVVKLRFQKAGSGAGDRYVVTGTEYVFEDRAVDGSASAGLNVPNTLRLGFTLHAHTVAGSSNAICNASINNGDHNGTYACWLDVFGSSISGDFLLVPGCAGVPGVAVGPDLLSR